MAPGGINLSDWNYGINRNEISWNVNYPSDRMQTTLCDSSSACYPYSYEADGYLYDGRSISYGRAKCNAWSQNIYITYVNWCYAAN